MAQTGYSPILIYGSTTTGNTPAAGNLTTGTSGVELAINATDGKLFYKDNAGVVQTIATKAGAAGTFSNVTITGGSINGTTIGATTASTGAFTTLSASSTVSGTGFSTYLASPPAIGGTTPAAGSFTTLSASSTVSGTGFSTYLASPPAIGSTAANTGAFTTLSASSTTTLSGGTANGVAYLNGSKVVTTGTALTFDGTTLTNETGSGVFASRDNFNLRAYAGSTNGTVVDINSAGTVGITKFSINNSEQMRLTSTGLGIGTSSPGYKLHVANYMGLGTQSSTGAGAGINMIPSSTLTNWFVGANYVNSGAFEIIPSTAGGGSTFSTPAFVLNSSGNLGLGVTPSAWGGNYKAIDVQYGSIANTTAGNADVAITQNAYYNGTNWIAKYTGASKRYAMSDSGHLWFNGAYATAGTAITFTQAMTLDAGGNLGIGTSSPGEKLQVVGTGATTVEVRAALNTAAAFKMSSAGGIQAGIFMAAPTVDSSLGFQTAGTERARIDSSGNLLVGTTTVIRAGKISVSFADASSRGIVTKTDVTTTSAALLFTNPNGDVGNITTSGSATAYNTSSDYRLKHDVAPMTGALAKVAALKPVTYKWNADNSDGEGFIAHELAEVVPQCVTGEKDAVDAEGNPVYQGIDTSFLVATLTAAIQEQQALIQTLTDRITALEGK